MIKSRIFIIILLVSKASELSLVLYIENNRENIVKRASLERRL